jgi:hypothetical protein
MRRLIYVSCLLIALLAVSILSVRRVSQVLHTPIDFSNRQALPDTPALGDMLPVKLGDFTRQQIIEPMHSVLYDSHLVARGSALYHRPTDVQSIYLELKLYRSPEIADLLFDPSNWPTHAANLDKYFVRGSPISYIFTEIRNGYLTYQLDYVRESWNISIQSIGDLQGLLMFANLYPY